MFRDTRQVVQSFQLLVSHQMRPFSSHCPLWVELYLFHRYSGIGEIWGNWTQILKITCRDTWKVIQSLQLFISHQMRPYSSVKALCGLSYTCFPGTWVLEQFWGTGPEYSKLCTRTQKVIKSLQLLIYYQRVLTSMQRLSDDSVIPVLSIFEH